MSIKSSISRNIKKICKTDFSWIRLNYTMTYHDPPPPTTIQNISTTTHHHPPPSTTSQNMSTTTHHYLPPPTNRQNISTTTHHQPEYIHDYLPFPKKSTSTPQKPKYIDIEPLLDIALTASFSSKCNISFRDGDFVW